MNHPVKQMTSEPKCAICHQHNDQLLMLSCEHDPCINCAAQHYFKGAQYRKQYRLPSEANYWCQICFEPTLIDKSSIEELIQYEMRKSKKSKSKNAEVKRSKSQRLRLMSKQQIQQTNPYNIPFVKASSRQKEKKKRSSKQVQDLIQLASSHNFQPSGQTPPLPPKITSMRSSLKNSSSAKNLQSSIKVSMKITNSCSKHEDESLIYYCFSCQKCVCVECALHGSHVGHQVEAVKKTTLKLKGMYDGLLAESQKCRATLQNGIKSIDKIVETVKHWNEKQSSALRQKFAQLHELLSQKQQSIMAQVSRIQEEALYMLKSQKQCQDQTLTSIKSLRKKLKISLATDPQQWNMVQLQTTRGKIRQICDKQAATNWSVKNMEKEVTLVQCGLVLEAIDTISQLVESFKIETSTNTNSNTNNQTEDD